MLIGRPKASSTGVRGRRAFFFVREQYLGTDAASPSLRAEGREPERQRDHARLHALTPSGDKPCCPSDGTVKVRFTIGDGRLRRSDPIPPAASRLPPVLA